MVAQTAKVEEDAGGPSSRGHLSDVSSSVAAPAPTGSLPAYQDMKSAAGMAPLSQDPCQVGVPTVSSFSDPEPPRASGALSNCLPLPLPSLDLGTGLPARKALSAFAAAAGAASSGRRPPKAPAGKGAGAGGKGAGGQLRVCGGDALRSGDSACEGAFLLRQKLGSGGFGAVYMATDVEHSRKIALKVQQPGKKFCQVALDEVALLSHLTQQRSSLLAALPPGASATDVANAAAAYAVQQSCQMSVAGRRPATTGAEAVDEVVGHSGGAGATDGDAGAEQAKAAALEAGAVAGAECIVRFYGHAIHKGPRGSQICIQMEALGPSLLDLLRHRQYRGVGVSSDCVPSPLTNTCGALASHPLLLLLPPASSPHPLFPLLHSSRSSSLPHPSEPSRSLPSVRLQTACVPCARAFPLSSLATLVSSQRCRWSRPLHATHCGYLVCLCARVRV